MNCMFLALTRLDQVLLEFVVLLFVFSLRVSITKQYNLVPGNGWWSLAAGKVTLWLASNWPHVAYISGSPTGSRPRRRRWALDCTLLWSMIDFTLILPLTRSPHAGSRVERIDPLHFLVGCHKRQLNHAVCPHS